MASDNYVSISGVTDFKQLKEISECVNKDGVQGPVVIGYQISHRSINRGTQNNRQPKFGHLGTLVSATEDSGLKPAFHYFTRDNGKIVEDLRKFARKVRPLFSKGPLVQFNTLPPSLETLESVKEMGFDIIFKVAVSNKGSSEGGYSVWKGKGVEDVNEGDVKALVDQVEKRSLLIDYVMFDPSHGTNLGLDLREGSLAVEFGKEVRRRECMNNIGLVYAGGMHPGNIEGLVRTLYGQFPEGASVDTESGVRDIGKVDGKIISDNFNTDSAVKFLGNYNSGLPK